MKLFKINNLRKISIRTITLSFIVFISFLTNTETIFADTINNDNTSNLSDTPTENQYENNINGVNSITLSQYLNKVNKNDKFIVFIGFKECTHCRKFSPVFKKFLSLTDQPIYYLDFGQNGSFKYSSQEQINEFPTTFKAPFEFLGTPTVALISEGKVSSMVVGDDTTLDDLQHLLNDSNIK